METIRVSVLYWEERKPEGNVHDEVVDEVGQALTESGFKVSQMAVSSDLRELLEKIEKQKPDIIFNLCERFADSDNNELNITSVLEILGVPFTGTGPVGMALRQDKAVTKKLFKFHDVPYPNFAVFDRVDVELAGKMHFPLIVKPLHGDASLGITDSSLVQEFSKLDERIHYIQSQLKEAALVEEYVEGREFYVGILGNDPPEVLPLMELDFSKLPAGFPRIYGHEAKAEPGTQQYKAVNALVATDLPPETRARITQAGKQAAAALKVRDYARVDIRLTPDGVPMVMEVNANPYLERTSAFALAALQAGMGYTTLVRRIVEAAFKRYGRVLPEQA